MRILLDTHAFLWWIEGNRRLSARARAAMQADENEVFVSAASVWEIATKVTLGKLSVSAGTAAGIVDEIGSQGFRPLDITVAHAHHAGSLAGTHRDPFDRMLIAQSVLEGISIVSNEALFDAYGVSRLW